MNINLLDHFDQLPDPRIDRTKRYPLIEIIFLVISAAISGCEGWKQIKDFGEVKLDWLRKFLPYSEGIPVDDTIARVMRKLDTKAFQKCFINWMKAVTDQTEGDIISIDGKTLRGSHDKKNGVAAIHMVSAWGTNNSVVLGQEKTAEKSNEITAIPELLNLLETKGCIVTIDAMGCQTAISEQIVKQKGDYVLALKGNQSNLHCEAKDFFSELKESTLLSMQHDFFEDIDKGHGRIETRKCWSILADSKYFPSCKKWRNIKSIIAIESTREIKDEISKEIRFYISSLEPNAKKSLNAIRSHWGVENKLHWTLDVTFREDESRVRSESSPENLAVIRHIALNVLRSDTSKKASIKRKRIFAALDDNYR